MISGLSQLGIAKCRPAVPHENFPVYFENLRVAGTFELVEDLQVTVGLGAAADFRAAVEWEADGGFQVAGTSALPEDFHLIQEEEVECAGEGFVEQNPSELATGTNDGG